MLENLVKTIDTCIAYYEKLGDKKKVKELKSKLIKAKKDGIFSEN